MPIDSTLEKYREYLELLGRLQLDGQMAAKVDVSGVVQVTLLEAFRRAQAWETLDDEAQTTWLRRAFVNNLLDEIRRFRTRARDVTREQAIRDAMEQSASRLNGWLVSPESSPSQKAIRRERAVQLASALATLTPPQRESIELHHLQGLSLEEVGQRMNRDKGAIAALIFRGTKQLRELLNEYEIG